MTSLQLWRQNCNCDSPCKRVPRCFSSLIWIHTHFVDFPRPATLRASIDVERRDEKDQTSSGRLTLFAKEHLSLSFFLFDFFSSTHFQVDCATLQMIKSPLYTESAGPCESPRGGIIGKIKGRKRRHEKQSEESKWYENNRTPLCCAKYCAKHHTNSQHHHHHVERRSLSFSLFGAHQPKSAAAYRIVSIRMMNIREDWTLEK